MSERVRRLKHAGIDGAAIQVAQEDTWDLNQMLHPEHRLTECSTVPFTYACAYIHHRGRHVMIDGGWEAREIVDALAELDVEPRDIDLVLITHGDGDHVLGLLTADDAATYPNASYVMHRELWDHWHDANSLTKHPEERQARIAALVAHISGRLTLLETEQEVSGGITALPCLGHREGHCTYEVAPAPGTDGGPIHHFGDALFHPLFAEHPDWMDTMALDPPAEAASRRKTLERAAASAALVLTCHIPFPGIGRIERAGEAFRWLPHEETT